MAKSSTSLRFSNVVKWLLIVLAEDMGDTQTHVAELAIRELAKQRGMQLPSEQKAQALLTAREQAKDRQQSVEE